MRSTTAASGAVGVIRDALIRSVGVTSLSLILLHSAFAQSPECARLQARLAQPDRGGGHLAQSLRRQRAELARSQSYAQQLGCDGFSFFGRNPQCEPLNARIAGLQAGLAQLQAAAGGGTRGDLAAYYDAHCRNGQPQEQARGFFESLFGGAPQPQGPPPSVAPSDSEAGAGAGDEPRARGGSQAVCVRTCDGGFFPLGLSPHHPGQSLTEMCQALCPGTEVAVFTRNPDSDIKTAVGLDGKSYMDLPNALHFQKTLTASCSCRPAGKSWAETLANAEEVLGNPRKGDIVVTPEKSAELSRPVLDAKTRAALVAGAPAASATSGPHAAASSASGATTDGSATRGVRQVGPQP